MKLHTSLTPVAVTQALGRAQDRGLVTRDVHMVVFTPGRSQTHRNGYEIQLGTYDKHSLPPGTVDQHGKTMRVRRYKNTGTRGANSDSGWAGNEGIWSATWHEWGWFMAEVFAADPGARWGQNPERSARPEYAWGYFSEAYFHNKTSFQFRLSDAPEPAPAPRTRHLRPSSSRHDLNRATRLSADDTLAHIDEALAGPSLDPAVFGPEDNMATIGYA